MSDQSADPPVPGAGPPGDAAAGYEVRDLGVVQGREVYPGDPDHPTQPGPGRGPGAGPAAGPDAGHDAGPDAGHAAGAADDERSTRQAAAFQQWLGRIREARAGIPNSRPLPPWVARLAWVLDSVFEVPFTRRRVGIDGLLTFIPVIGDAAGVTLSMAVVAAGIASGVSFPTIVRMMLNVGLEALVGVVPFVGALFDMAYKANERNVLLIEADFADRQGTRRSSLKVLLITLLAVGVAIGMALLAAAATLAVTIWFLRWLIGLF